METRLYGIKKIGTAYFIDTTSNYRYPSYSENRPKLWRTIIEVRDFIKRAELDRSVKIAVFKVVEATDEVVDFKI